jgi:cell division protein FtsI (penicillin-binding protein 3)
VVEERGGTGTKAKLDDFPVAGKTGTAQKVNLLTGGYSSKRIGSFVGFVPADAPRAVILVLIDEPRTASYGGVVAAPVFRAIASAVLKRLAVEPTTSAAQEAAATPAPRPAPVAADVAVASSPSATPSFLGLSLREAVTLAEAAGWEVEVTGTGYVAAQQPMPGAPLAADRRLALRLAVGETLGTP